MQIIQVEDTARRDPYGITLATFFLLMTVGLVWAAVVNGGWYWWLILPASLTGLFGAAGLAQDSRKLTRDEQGRPTSE
ncbi:hypothetical protein AN219_18480 [Streptomyces nanshensis]|nr:hypothetical protein AN219_18480 [Streptomyces nanshensis]